MTRRASGADQRVGTRLRRTAADLVPRITAGLGPADLRALARGEEPGRPDPRDAAHASSFWLHIKPRTYHEAATRLTHTWRLGLISVVLLAVETVTGLLLMPYYTPSPERAYGDVVALASRVPFGQLVRDVHRLAAEMLVVVVVLHLVRTFLTGSYKAPRRFTWLTGVLLLVATLLASFSGYLLPWDQLAYWAVSIGTSLVGAVPPRAVGSAIERLLLGGPTVGAAGLLRFYVLHVLVVPVALAIGFAVHYYKVVVAGISLPAGDEEVGADTARRVPVGRRRHYLPDILVDEILCALLVLVAVVAPVVLGLYPGAPLESHANPSHTPYGAAAPWFLLWLQGLLKLGRPVLAGIAVPGLFVALLLALPYIDANRSRRLRDRPLAAGLVAVVLAAFVALTWLGRPAHAVTGPPAEAVIQALLPEEDAGPLRQLHWSDLTVGEWDSRTYGLSTAGPALRQVLAAYDGQIEEAHARSVGAGEPGLPGGYGKLIVQRRGRGLKKVTARVFWRDEDGAERALERTVFMHEAAVGGR